MIEVKKENLQKSKIKLTIKVPSALMAGYFDTIYTKMAANVEVKGFRKGHAPKPLTISVIGENKLSEEIINLALNETYVEALKKEEIIPIAPPRINITMVKDLTVDTAALEYEAEVELLPEVKIGDYKKIKIKKTGEVKVDKEEINQVLKHLQEQHATFEDKTGPVKIGDRIEMDFEGTERGVVLDNLTSKNYPVILGSKVLIPEFEKEVIGMKKGDKKEFDVTLGKDKNKKKIHFKVDILTTQSVLRPELDDKLAGKFQQKSLDGLKEAIEKDIVEQKTIAQNRQQEAEVAESLVKISKIDVPDSLIEQETHRMIDDLKQRISMMGMPFEDYLGQMKKTEADLHADFEEQAEKTVKVGLIMGEIGKLEKIDLKAEDAGRQVMQKLLEYAKK